jgi:DNA-binding MarR family transcriptional regulator
MSNDPAPTGRFEYSGLDRLLHERARLGILASLAAHPKGLAFGDLKRLCGLTDGNLSRHLAALQAAEVVAISKDFHRNRPRTTCRITASGRARFADYLAELEQVVADASAAVRSEKQAPRRTPLPHGAV